MIGKGIALGNWVRMKSKCSRGKAMKKSNYILRNEKIKKWVGMRKGRTTLLAELVNVKRTDLYKLIFDNRMSPELIYLIERRQIEIEDMEKECIRQFPYFKRFIMKGEGRLARLAAKLEVSGEILRGLARARGDSRYLLMKYGVQKVRSAMQECEKARQQSSYSHEKLDVKAYVTDTVKKKFHSLSEIIDLANVVKENADFGNHDAAIICRVVGEDRYKVLSIGFDTVFTDMCKSHVCEKKNRHIHALMFAAVSLSKKVVAEIESLICFTHNAPCPNCAARIIPLGIKAVYCLYEPELMDGLKALSRNNIPVIKVNVYSKTQTQINDAVIAA